MLFGCDGGTLFGRDSDSEYSDDVDEALVAVAAPTIGGNEAPTGGFLGQTAAPPPEGKALEGEEDQEKDSPPPQMQGGAQPKKTLPRPVYEGDAAALLEMLLDASCADENPDIAKVRELLDAGIDIRYQVRPPLCVCMCVRVLG